MYHSISIDTGVTKDLGLLIYFCCIKDTSISKYLSLSEYFSSIYDTGPIIYLGVAKYFSSTFNICPSINLSIAKYFSFFSYTGIFEYFSLAIDLSIIVDPTITFMTKVLFNFYITSSVSLLNISEIPYSFNPVQLMSFVFNCCTFNYLILLHSDYVLEG